MRGLILLLAALTFGCRTTLPSQELPHAPVDAFLAALTNADSDAVGATFLDDATVFMPFDSMPERVQGRDAIRSAFERFFVSLRQSASAPPYMKLEPRELHMQTLGDTAIVTFHLGTAGGPSFSRRTFVLQRVHGRWRIAHLHASNIRPAS
jgi:ketosteroid isomerase-like protein